MFHQTASADAIPLGVFRRSRQPQTEKRSGSVESALCFTKFYLACSHWKTIGYKSYTWPVGYNAGSTVGWKMLENSYWIFLEDI